ncbi:MAG: ParA family protein [Caldilineaceae bacterium SB0670_bin_27]|uniref:ParA family protein n=1 Tax=Caldilineaceae bacterium SB0664_bin_27 TaxID=2605260 RepID=A0A6B0YVA9_9CHLR|nr:ParA family protein [Caldilineaceae bacterium SB0664_bin_27]MYJ79342.1 ParA family protein [Caldilineaceae bacterium SB0670_bin_27]
MTAQIFAIANQKGGVGKTTTAVNLCAYLAGAGCQVLLIDSDPQANATTSLGIDPRKPGTSLYDVLMDNRPIQEAVTATTLPGLSLVPANLDLAGAEVEMAARMAREQLLSRALQPLSCQYDYVFIDDPPSLGLITINGLTAADGIIIPVQCEYLALEGLSQLLNTIEQVRKVLNGRLKVAGVLLTMSDARTNLSTQVEEDVRAHFPLETFETLIPRSVRLSEAPSHGLAVLSYAPESAGALAYEALAAEFIGRFPVGVEAAADVLPGSPDSTVTYR